MLFTGINRKNGETPYWRFLRDKETNDNEFDIWSMMKSQTMREYYKNNIKLSTEAMIDIICRSYKSIYEKLEYINQFIHHNSVRHSDDVKLLMQVYYAYQFLIDVLKDPNRIFDDNIKILYAYRSTRFLCNDFDEYSWDNIKSQDIFLEYQIEPQIELFDNFDNIITDINKGSNTIYNINHIDVFAMSNQNIPKKIMTFIMRDNFINIEWWSLNGINEFKQLDKNIEFGLNTISNINSYYLPFNNGDEITLSIPEFKYDINGIVFKELSDIWYSWIYNKNSSEDECSISLTYSSICERLPYSIFDIIR